MRCAEPPPRVGHNGVAQLMQRPALSSSRQGPGRRAATRRRQSRYSRSGPCAGWKVHGRHRRRGHDRGDEALRITPGATLVPRLSGSREWEEGRHGRNATKTGDDPIYLLIQATPVEDFMRGAGRASPAWLSRKGESERPAMDGADQDRYAPLLAPEWRVSHISAPGQRPSDGRRRVQTKSRSDRGRPAQGASPRAGRMSGRNGRRTPVCSVACVSGAEHPGSPGFSGYPTT
jgi:hypothetical protein